jgi:hypothetical protein
MLLHAQNHINRAARALPFFSISHSTPWLG